MNTIYVIEQGAVVRLSSKSLVITKERENILQAPLIKIDRLLLFGNIQLTTQAMNELLQEGIDVAFLTMNGKLRGRLVATESKNVFLRLAQYERHLDDAFPVNLARTIIKAKLRNQKAVILRYQRNHPEQQFPSELQVIEETLRKIDKQKTVHSLMGSEGIATANYFKAFGGMFRKELTFTERSRRPPKDPVNSILSFGYILLTNEILSLVIAHGLDPYIGFLHGEVYGRPSLALDLVEEFRHSVVDRMTLALFNNGILTEKDFQHTEDQGVRLTAEGLKTFFKHYEKRLRAPLDAKKPTINLRAIMKRQVRNMAKTIQTLTPYKPFCARG